MVPQSQYSIRRANLADASNLRIIEIAAAQRFREAIPIDLPDVLFDRSFDQNLLKHLIVKEQVFVACNDQQEVVGFVIVESHGDEVYIEEVDVLPEHGRQGLGARLVDAAIHWAEEQGFNKITLSTFTDVAWNAPFYKKLGFEVVQQERWSQQMLAIHEQEKLNGLPGNSRIFMQKTLVAQ